MSTVVTGTAAVADGSRPLCNSNMAQPSEDTTVGPKSTCSSQIESQADDKDNDKKHNASGTASVIYESQSSSSPRSKVANCSDATATKDSSNEVSGTFAGEPTPPTRRQSTTSRFREKRPEPLKLNPNPNQDIPLDLSVKSAGNVPSSTLGNIFNLGQLNPMAPLETPRIQWQDNDSLLASAKNRLFSSSTTASHRARISSIMGESPPITPNTPLMDVMFSSNGTASSRLPNDPPHSATLALESPFHSLLTSPFDPDKLYILDRLSQPNKRFLEYQQMRADVRGTPRRSCSTDNLQLYMNSGQRNQTIAEITSSNKSKSRQDDRQSPSCVETVSKKHSISPLAIKSFSNRTSEFDSPTKFLYSNQHITTNNNNNNDSQQSPNGKSLTPTSVTNATVNLFNIHLNSPNSNSRHSPSNSMLGSNKSIVNDQQHKSPSLDYESGILDLPSPVSHSQQQNVRIPLSSFSSSSNGLDYNNNQHSQTGNHQRQSNPSISSTATLNTPTLISPSQMKTGQLCLLPSPTLSPLSSMFDLPSPFLMFATSSAQGNSQHGSLTNLESKIDLFKTGQGSISQKSDANRDSKSEVKQIDKSLAQNTHSTKITKANLYSDIHDNSLRSPTNLPQQDENVLTRKDLSRLITSADQKTCAYSESTLPTHQDDTFDDVVVMDIDQESRRTVSGNVPLVDQNLESSVRPSTVIPQICVSQHSQINANKDKYNNNNNNGQRDQRDLLCKRSLSPKTFSSRVKNYHNERLESSSAPPDVHQRRKRSKIKTATADSCFELADKGGTDKTNTNTGAIYTYDNKLPGLSQSSCNLNYDQPNRTSGRPYPDTRCWLTTSNQQLESRNADMDSSTFLNGRSSSAEPAIYSVDHPNKTAPCLVSNGNPENLTISASQSASYLYHGGQVGSTGSQHQLDRPGTLQSTQVQSSIQHQQLHYHSPSSQQMQYPQQIVNYDQQQYSAQQLYSMSTGDLNKLHYSRHNYPSTAIQQPPTTNTMASENDAALFTQATPHYHAHQQSQFALGHQDVLSTLDKIDCHPQFSDQGRSGNHPSNITHSGSLIRHMSLQPTTAQLFCRRFEVCNQHSPQDGISNRNTSAPSFTTGQTSAVMCGNSPTSQQRMIRPYPVDTDSRPESRSSCSLDFTAPFGGSNGSRSNSAASSNLAAKKYHCDQCSKSFTRSDMLTRHRRLHSGDRPFQCTECKQEFSRSDHLSTHMRTHTGEKPYKCKLCTYSACRKDMITRHLKVHNRSPNMA